MKKLYVILCCIVAILFAHNGVNAQTTVVRFMVELPGQGISQDSAVYLAGSFNGWSPNDENYRMARVDSRHYKLDVPCFADKKYEYKYSLGGWGHGEKAIDGKEIDNRKFTSTKRLKIKDVVAAWNVPTPKKETPNPLAGMLSKEQIGQMMQMKDSISKSLAPAIPKLMGVVQKLNMNLLADMPDPVLGKQINAEAIEIVSGIVDSVTNSLLKVISVLTPEQKLKLRDAVKNSTNPGDLINILNNPKTGTGDK